MGWDGMGREGMGRNEMRREVKEGYWKGRREEKRREG